jgi:hypothetical protein
MRGSAGGRGAALGGARTPWFRPPIVWLGETGFTHRLALSGAGGRLHPPG